MDHPSTSTIIMVHIQWQIQDFPLWVSNPWGLPTHHLTFLPRIAWKWKKLDQEGHTSLVSLLDLSMTLTVYQICKLFYHMSWLCKIHQFSKGDVDLNYFSLWMVTNQDKLICHNQYLLLKTHRFFIDWLASSIRSTIVYPDPNHNLESQCKKTTGPVYPSPWTHRRRVGSTAPTWQVQSIR